MFNSLLLKHGRKYCSTGMVIAVWLQSQEMQCGSLTSPISISDLPGGHSPLHSLTFSSLSLHYWLLTCYQNIHFMPQVIDSQASGLCSQATLVVQKYYHYNFSKQIILSQKEFYNFKTSILIFHSFLSLILPEGSYPPPLLCPSPSIPSVFISAPV